MNYKKNLLFLFVIGYSFLSNAQLIEKIPNSSIGLKLAYLSPKSSSITALQVEYNYDIGKMFSIGLFFKPGLSGNFKDINGNERKMEYMNYGLKLLGHSRTFGQKRINPYGAISFSDLQMDVEAYRNGSTNEPSLAAQTLAIGITGGMAIKANRRVLIPIYVKLDYLSNEAFFVESSKNMIPEFGIGILYRFGTI